MKILYYFQELDTPMFQWQRKHFLDELARKGVSIETFNPLLYSNTEEANEKLIKKAKEGGFDLMISNMGYYKMLYVDSVREIKKIGIPTMRIAWDNLMIPYIDKVLAPHFDLVWLTARETEQLYKKWGVKYFFAPYAANPFTYCYQEVDLKRCACFIGNPHGSRALMINTLTKNGMPVEVYHGGKRQKVIEQNKPQRKYNIINPSTSETLINRLKFREGRILMYGSIINKLKGATSVENNERLKKYSGLSHEDMVSTYAAVALSLASTSAGHTDVLKNPLNIINLRNFEIPMCGGIEICKYSEEIAEYFEDGKEIVLYNDEYELAEKARYYIERASDNELRQMKLAARKRAEADHTWWNRFKIAFDYLGLKYD